MNKRILVVDDSASWRRFHIGSIQTYFPNTFETYQADCAHEGLKVVEDNKDKPFDIIISDLQMELNYEPDTAGEWLVKQIKFLPEYKNTKIIIISAMFNIEQLAKELNVEYLKKSTLAHSNLPLKLKIEELTN